MPPLPTPDSALPGPSPPSLPSLPPYEVMAAGLFVSVFLVGWLWTHPRQLLRIASWPVRLGTFLWTTGGALVADHGGRRVRTARRGTRAWLARTLPDTIAPAPPSAIGEERTYLRIRPAADSFEPAALVEAFRTIHPSPPGGVFPSPTRFEFLIAAPGDPNRPIEFYLGGPGDPLAQLAAYDPDTFDVEAVAFHPAETLGTQLAVDPTTAANPTDAVLNELAATGVEPVTYRFGTWAYRWKDWMMRLVGLTDALDADRAESEPPVHPLNGVIDEIGACNEHGVSALYQVTFTPFRGWYHQAKARKERLRKPADTLRERIANFELSTGERDDTAEAAYRAKKMEQHRAEPALDIGGVAGQRYEQLSEKETETSFLANVRVAAIPTADVPRAEVVERLQRVATALRGFERDFYHFQSLPSRWLERVAGRLRLRGARHRTRLRRLCERQVVTPTFGHRPWNLRRRWPDVVCNPDELAAFATVPCTAHLRLESTTGPYMESQPAHTRALRELTPSQRTKYLDAIGLWLGHLLDADGSVLPDASLSLPVNEQFVHVVEAGASGTGKTTNAIKRALTAFATTTGPTILITGLGGHLAENYMRAHAALFGLESLDTHVHHFAFPEGMPGFTFFDLRQMESPYREFASRDDAIQHRISRYLAILHHLMPEEKLSEAPNSVTVLENLVRAGFDEDHWHENMPMREAGDYFAQWQLQALRARFYEAHEDTRGTATPPELSNWSYNQNLHEQLTAPAETFAAVMTGVRNRMDQLIRDNRYQQLMNNTEPRFSFTDVLGPDRDAELLPDDRGVFIFDLSDIQEERQKGMALLLLTELFTGLKTYKKWLAGATIETTGVTPPAADGGVGRRQSGRDSTATPPADSSSPASDGVSGAAAAVPGLPTDDAHETEGPLSSGEIPADWVTNVVVDEAAVVAGIDLVSKLLREARNLRVSMHLLMQYPKQLEEQIGEEAYNELLNNVQTRILGTHNLDDEVAAQVLPRGMDTAEFRRQIGDLPRSHRVVQLPPQGADDRPQPFTIHRGPLPPGHLAAPLSADEDDAVPYTEAEIQDAIDAVTTQTQEQYGLPPDLRVGPPAVTVPEELQAATGLGDLDTPEALALMAHHAQQAAAGTGTNQWVGIDQVLNRFRLWLDDVDATSDPDTAGDGDEDGAEAGAVSGDDTDGDGAESADATGHEDETERPGQHVADSELVTIIESSPYLDLRAGAELAAVEVDAGLYVRLTAAGRDVVAELQDTGETGAAGSDKHDDLLAAIEAALIPHGFEVIRPTQDLTEQPDAWGRHPSIPFDLVLEVEHSGLTHPDKPLINLRTAQEAGAFPVFVVRRGDAAADEDLTAHAARLQNILADPVRTRTADEIRFYTYTNRHVTAHGGAGNGGETAVRPVADEEEADARRTIWTAPHDADGYVLENPAGVDRVFATVSDAPLGEFPAYYTYSQTPDGEPRYTVHVGGDTYGYTSRTAFEADWETVQYPFIPDEEFPVPDYGPTTYAIVIVTGDLDPGPANAVLYDVDATTPRPLESLVEALTDEDDGFAPATPPASDGPARPASEQPDADSSPPDGPDAAPPSDETPLTPKQRSVNEFATLLEGEDAETIESLDVETLPPEELVDAPTSTEVFTVYRVLQTYREQPAYTRPSQFTGQLATVRAFTSRRIRDPTDRDTRITYWVGLSWAPEIEAVVTTLLDALADRQDDLADVDPEQALADGRVRTYVDLLVESLSTHQ